MASGTAAPHIFEHVQNCLDFLEGLDQDLNMFKTKDAGASLQL
jgi:hypothetical protein